MNEVRITELSQHVGESVRLRGWVGQKRKSGQIRFMNLRDGSSIVQLVFSKENMNDADWELFGKLKQESSVVVSGIVQKSDRAFQQIEVVAHQITAVHIPDTEYPISHKEHGPDFLLSVRHLWIRSRKQSAILRIRHEICRSVREFLNKLGFYETPAPIFTPTACEGTSTLFSVPYFDLGNVYLSQSGQLYGEAMAMAVGKIYTFTPAFRAEKSKTRRHLTEFWMVEPEMAWVDHEENLKIIEGLIRYLLERCLEECQPDFQILERDVRPLEGALKPFRRISYREAIAWLGERGRVLSFGDDFGAEDESLIGQNSETPVFITHYPTQSRAFYMKLDPKDSSVVLNCDLIAPEGYGEIVGGSEREENLDILKSRIASQNLNMADLEWYLDLRRFGSVPHAGFGLGIERTVAWICGVPHIRECIPFPRTIYRVTP